LVVSGPEIVKLFHFVHLEPALVALQQSGLKPWLKAAGGKELRPPPLIELPANPAGRMTGAKRATPAAKFTLRFLTPTRNAP
jgi:hypothetical protein